ncbi:MAG: hypothetical protein ABWY78_06170 [Microvirga sp.]
MSRRYVLDEAPPSTRPAKRAQPAQESKSAGLAAVEGILKEIYEPFIVESLNQSTAPLLGYIAEGQADEPDWTNKRPGEKRVPLPTKSLYGRVRISGARLKDPDPQRSAFAEARRREMDRLVKDVARQEDQAITGRQWVVWSPEADAWIDEDGAPVEAAKVRRYELDD